MNFEILDEVVDDLEPGGARKPKSNISVIGL